MTGEQIRIVHYKNVILYSHPMLFSIFFNSLGDRRLNILPKSSDNTKLGEAASVWEDRIRIQN